MALLLCSEPQMMVTRVAEHAERGLVALLTDSNSALAGPLVDVKDELIVVDVNGPRLSRLNFDALALAVMDLDAASLLSSGGRRLVDALGHLAADDELTLAFTGPAVGLTGAFLEDGVTVGLNLIPGALVLPAIQEVADLQALLTRLSEYGLRLLTLDAPVCLRYDYTGDTVSVAGAEIDGDSRKGSALMIAFRSTGEGQPPTARLHALTAGMTRGWP